MPEEEELNIENLTFEQQEYVNCALDPVYYLNHYGYTYDAEKNHVDKMKCFDFQEDCVDLFEENTNSVILKSRQCLPENTCVDTPKGPKFIQDLKPGDKVFSYNFRDKKVEIDEVYDAWCSGDRQCVEFKVGDNLIEVGEKHPFYTTDKNSFIKAKYLEKGNKILSRDGKDKEISSDIKQTLVKKCYDISVNKNENFFIDGLLTHNTGMSTITAGYVAWKIIFREGEKILIIANDGDGAVRFLATVKQFLDYTPAFLLPGNTTKRIINNQKHVELQNHSWAKAKASSPDAGRGDSLTLLVLDETAFIDYADEIWMAAGIALSVTGGKSIMLSTPAGAGGLYYNTWTKSERKENDFANIKVHWTQNPFCSKGLEMRTDENGEKKYWSPWYEKECRRLEYDSVKIAQELDLSFEGSKHLAIENELVTKYEKRLELDEYKNIINNRSYYDYRAPEGKRFVDYESNFFIYKKPVPGHKYIMGNDVARGDATDFSTAQILDIDELEIVAEYRDKIAPDLFAKLIYNVGMDYNTAFLAVEVNAYGLGVTFDLNRKMGYKNMFFSKSIKELHSKDFVIEENEDIPGFQTTKRSRPIIINNLRSHMREGLLKLYSFRIMRELRNFIQKGERPEAEKGFNDDLIFALAIALYIRDTEYKNAAIAQSTYKAMLEAMSYDSTNLSGNRISTFDKEEAKKKEESMPDGIGSIYYTKNKLQDDDDGFNDIDWLLK